MNRWFSIHFTNFGTKDQTVYPRIVLFCEEWNKNNKLKFEFKDDYCTLILPYNAIEQAKEFIKIAKENNWENAISLKKNLTQADYLTSDYVYLRGAGINDKFLDDAENPTTEASICAHCGKKDMYYMKFEQPFIFNEVYTKKSQNDGTKCKNRWDIITLGYSSGLFISKELVAFFEANKVTGYTLAEVIDKKTGKPSTNYFRVQADVHITTQCHKHTLRKEDTSACKHCGDEIESDFLSERFFKESDVQGKDIFVHSTFEYGRTYISNRLYKLIVASEFEGMEELNFATICKH